MLRTFFAFGRRYVAQCVGRFVGLFVREHSLKMLSFFRGGGQRYTYRVLQTIQMKLIFLCVWAERAILGIAKTALKFKYEV